MRISPFLTHPSSPTPSKPNLPAEPPLFERLKKILIHHLTSPALSKFITLFPKENQPLVKKGISTVLFLKKGPGLAGQALEGLGQIKEEQYGEGVKTSGLALCKAASFVPLLSSDPKTLLTGLSLEITGDLFETYDEARQGHYLESASAFLSAVKRAEKAIRISSNLIKIEETQETEEEKEAEEADLEEELNNQKFCLVEL